MHSSASTESSWFGRLAMIDGGLLQDAAQMKLDELSAVQKPGDWWNQPQSRVSLWSVVSQIIMSAVMMAVQWRWRGRLAQFITSWSAFEDCTCDSALEVCGIQSVDQVSDQHLTMLEEEEGSCRT
jgi:hypothetical protein